jgi:hypothetical protein
MTGLPDIKKAEEKVITFGVPQDKELLAAIGTVSIRHGHLDHVLRMCIKTFADLELKEAEHATACMNSSELRKLVEKLAKQKLGEGAALLKVRAILNRSRIASETRNNLIHNLWGQDLEGVPVVRKDNYSWHTVPSVSEVQALSLELANIAQELNLERQVGFINEALKKSKL